ncbi:MAG TPA: response regulator transcription factor [Chitinophagaceae bacterium]|jgi:DNA-binding NarL/FixJ family response regulator|nr:response regulator transcription factor [Chitinophagaceae bacterium]
MEKQITILIADDNHRVRESLRMLIGEMEHTKFVGEAANGTEAIALAAELSPDIILMDINISPVNGLEAAREILLHDPSSRIIGLSLHSLPFYARNFLQLGAKGFVSKMAPVAEIIEAIKIVAEGGVYIDKNLRSII